MLLVSVAALLALTLAGAAGAVKHRDGFRRSAPMSSGSSATAPGAAAARPSRSPGSPASSRSTAAASMRVALRSDGTVWAWGHNNYGEVGDGTKTNRQSPVQVAAPDRRDRRRDRPLLQHGAQGRRHRLDVGLEQVRDARRRHDHEPHDARPGARPHGRDRDRRRPRPHAGARVERHRVGVGRQRVRQPRHRQHDQLARARAGAQPGERRRDRRRPRPQPGGRVRTAPSGRGAGTSTARSATARRAPTSCCRCRSAASPASRW